MFKVLLVDDESWARYTVKRFGDWERLGLAVVGEAENGAAALSLIESCSPDIIITDMKMPVVDGVDFLKYMEESRTHIKIVVVSGYEDFDYTKQAIKSKVVEYILKPIDRDELNGALRKCIAEINAGRTENYTGILSGNHTEVRALNLIIRYKSLLRLRLIELNLVEVKKLIDDLCNHLGETVPDILQGQLADKVCKEFVSLVEEYVVGNGYDIGQIMDNIRNFAAERDYPDGFGMLKEYLIRLFDITIASIADKNRRKDGKLVCKVKAYIDKNYSMDLTLNLLAGTFFISKEYLSKAFKTEFGKNLTDYIVERRMETAQKLVRENSMPLKDIAPVVGYSDINYFYKIFKRYFGMSPGQMRSGSPRERLIFYN